MLCRVDPLVYHAHRESEEFFRLTGQLAQPNQDYVFSKRAAFFNGLKIKLDTSWPGLQRLELTSTSNLLPPLSLAPLPATSTPIISMPLASPTTSFCLPDLAHERATSPLSSASAFAFRSFTLFTRIPSAFAPLGNKRHHHRHNTSQGSHPNK